MSKDNKIHKRLTYFELVEKAKKLKALSDRGIGGEKDSAYNHYINFIKKHGVDENDVDEEKNKRKFYIKDQCYETILSYIIMSVNPFSFIKRIDNDYIVELDEEDFVEVKYKMGIFYESFKKDLNYIKTIFSFSSKKDELVFLTAFIAKNMKNFEPDEYAWSKKRGSMGKKVNPDVEKKEAEKNESEKNDKEKSLNEKKEPKTDGYNDENAAQPLSQFDLSRYMEYIKMLENIIYVRANKTIKNDKTDVKWIITD